MRALPTLGPVLVALFLPACGFERPTVEEYLAVATEAIRLSEEDARAAASQGSATGPLLLDLASFAVGSLRTSGERISSEAVAAAMERLPDNTFRPTPRDSSFTCMDMELGPSCWVPFNGVAVRLNVASRAPGRMIFHVASSVTASNFIPPLICERILRLDFEEREGRWVLAASEPTRTC